MMKKDTMANFEIAVDRVPRSYRVDKQIAIDSARYLTTFTRLPPSQWGSARTTNSIERTTLDTGVL
jgi:hypothetical protein